MVAAAASEASVPVVMHLDHGSSYELAMQAFRAGYTSVMIDGSHHVFEENIEITKSVVRACHAAGIPVEAELGKVGGKEDDLDGGSGNGYTVPSEAAEFAERTGVDSLAVAIGTAHGVYKGTPKLDIERLSEIRKVVSVPLVLHGTSGVPDDAVRECVARGMCKVNYATDLRIAFSGCPSGCPLPFFCCVHTTRPPQNAVMLLRGSSSMSSIVTAVTIMGRLVPAMTAIICAEVWMPSAKWPWPVTTKPIILVVHLNL